MTDIPSFESYLKDHAEFLGFRADLSRDESAYEFNLRAAYQSLISGEVLAGAVNVLKEMRGGYANGDPNLLFYPQNALDDMQIFQKPFRSTLHKLYRHNVVFNHHYPEEPRDGGLIHAINLYERIDDLLRTQLVCKYMDGPKFVCTALAAHCRSSTIDHKFHEMSTDAGYYAWHFYMRAPVQVMIAEGDVQTHPMWFEIQLSTQLAELITSLTHGLYQERREGRPKRGANEWKWEARSPQFQSAYIGHGLHLLEEVIQTFRDNVLGLVTPSQREAVDSVDQKNQAETRPADEMPSGAPPHEKDNSE